jgi:hypothetical protein
MDHTCPSDTEQSPHERRNTDPHGHDRHRRSGDRPGSSRRQPGRGRVRLDGPSTAPPGRSCRTGAAKDGTPDPGPTSSSPSPAPATEMGNCSATELTSKATPPHTGSAPKTPVSKRSPPRCSSTGPPASPTAPTTSPPRPPNCPSRTANPTPAGRTRSTSCVPATTGRDTGAAHQYPLTTSLRFLRREEQQCLDRFYDILSSIAFPPCLSTIFL